jgi:hypothetical protein
MAESKPKNRPTRNRAASAPGARVEPNHAPVAIPVGSYDREKLDEGLSKAVDTYGTNREQELDRAFSAARLGEGTAVTANPATLPDHKFVEVPCEVDDAGKPTRFETIQVYDPTKADQHIASQQPIMGQVEMPVDEKGKPTDLERARMAAVKAAPVQQTNTAPRAPVVEQQAQAEPPAGPDAGKTEENAG